MITSSVSCWLGSLAIISEDIVEMWVFETELRGKIPEIANRRF